MTDPNSPEEIEKRKNQEDPIVMYFIVRESLGMGMGKTAAQCAHAAQMVAFTYARMASFTESLSCGASEAEEIFEQWLNTSFRKVVLKADEKEWAKVKELYKDDKLVGRVVDSGLTEIAAGSETVLGLWPMKRSLRPKLIGKLQALK